jgi:hypothetical protein
LANHSKIVHNDLRLVAKIVENMDKKWTTWRLASSSGNGLDDYGEVNSADVSGEEKLDPNPYLTAAREYLDKIETGTAQVTTVFINGQGSEAESTNRVKKDVEEQQPPENNRSSHEISEEGVAKSPATAEEEESIQVDDDVAPTAEKSKGNKVSENNGNYHHGHHQSELSSNDELVLLNEDENLNLDMDDNSMNAHSTITGTENSTKKGRLSLDFY